MITEESESSH